MFRFKCATCDAWHQGMPSYGADAPSYHYSVPPEERATRCELGSDQCIIDGKWFFVRGCLEIPVDGETDKFSWGVWISLSENSYRQ